MRPERVRRRQRLDRGDVERRAFDAALGERCQQIGFDQVITARPSSPNPITPIAVCEFSRGSSKRHADSRDARS